MIRFSPSTQYSRALKALPPSSCVTLGKLLDLSVPEFLHPKNVIENLKKKENRPATWVAVGTMRAPGSLV